MTPEQFRATLKALDISQQAAAKLLGVDGRTAQRWALGEREIPPPASRFLRYLTHIGARAEAVRAIIDGAEEADAKVLDAIDVLAVPKGAKPAGTTR